MRAVISRWIVIPAVALLVSGCSWSWAASALIRDVLIEPFAFAVADADRRACQADPLSCTAPAVPTQAGQTPAGRQDLGP